MTTPPTDASPGAPAAPVVPAVSSARWTSGQILTLVALTLGYTGFYLCRVNYSVSKPSLLKEFGPQGVDSVALGAVDSAGTLCYAFGKILLGIAADFFSAKGVFILAMAGSVAATVAFAASSGRLGFLLSWCVNRSVQSAGWGALTKITSRWFAADQYGRAMAILALSYFFGDALARLLYGQLLESGMSWRGLYVTGAVLLSILAVACLFAIREAPAQPVAASSRSVFDETGDKPKPESLGALLAPFFQSPVFWCVCVMSAGLTFTRETFNSWTPLYLSESLGLTPAEAARSSSLFPFFGGISVLAAGWASDRLFRGRRGVVMVCMLIPACVCLIGLSMTGPQSDPWTGRMLISGAALGMLGPYAFLSGAIALDLGSRKGSASAAGMIDAVGYFAGALAGAPIAKIAKGWGWSGAFTTLAATVVVVTIAAAMYWRSERRKDRAAGTA